MVHRNDVHIGGGGDDWGDWFHVDLDLPARRTMTTPRDSSYEQLFEAPFYEPATRCLHCGELLSKTAREAEREVCESCYFDEQD